MRKDTAISILALLITCLVGLGITYVMDFSATPQAAAIKKSQIAHYKPAPAVTFKTLDGNSLTLESLKGKIILLNFWATWCAPCVVEFPQMIKLATENEDIVFLAASVDTNRQAITRFLKKQNQNYLNHEDVIMAWDENKLISMDAFQVLRYPETIIISPQGKMVDKVVGQIDWLKDETLTRIRKAANY